MKNARDQGISESAILETRSPRHVFNSVGVHVTANDWLTLEQQQAPLLPYEIELWGKHFLTLLEEPLPIPIVEHHKIAMAGKLIYPTHLSPYTVHVL